MRGVGLGGVVRMGVAAGNSEQVSDAAEIKEFVQLLKEGLLFAWWQVMVPVLSIRSDSQMSPNRK